MSDTPARRATSASVQRLVCATYPPNCQNDLTDSIAGWRARQVALISATLSRNLTVPVQCRAK